MYSLEEAAQEFHDFKRELLQIQLLASREARIRSRSRWLALGERPRKYFLNLEKKNYDDRSIAALVNKQGILVTAQEDILALEKEYYAGQHSDLSPIPEEDPYCPPPLSTLDDLDRHVLNSDLTEEELERAMRKMKSGKSPGWHTC